MNGKIVRVAEAGGGRGFRRVNVCSNREVRDFVIMDHKPKTIDDVIKFIGGDLIPGTIGIAATVAGDICNHDTILNSPNLHVLDGVSLASEITKQYSLPSIVGNDMETAAMGQIVLLPEEKYFMIITIGGGIGYRVVKDGQIISQAEGGHMCIDLSPFALPCGCGGKGCVEAIASGTAAEWRVKMMLQAQGITLPEGKHPC